MHRSPGRAAAREFIVAFFVFKIKTPAPERRGLFLIDAAYLLVEQVLEIIFTFCTVKVD